MTDPEAEKIARELTPGVKRWLLTLQQEGAAKRARGNVGYKANRAGLTCWAAITPDGQIVPRTWDYASGLANGEEVGEMLSPLGVRVAEALGRQG